MNPASTNARQRSTPGRLVAPPWKRYGYPPGWCAGDPRNRRQDDASTEDVQRIAWLVERLLLETQEANRYDR